MISLYVKTHNKTGLKYFGKTKRPDPHRYAGSGIYWRRHLKIHGNDVTTEVIAQFSEDQLDELTAFAIDFSVQNNIVESEDWANFTIETGLDAHNALCGKRHPMWGKYGEQHQQYGKPLSDESRKRMSEWQKGKPKSQEHKRKISETLKGCSIPEEVRRKIGESLKGKMTGELSPHYEKSWFTNGDKNVLAYVCPNGFYKGRTLPRRS